MPYLIDLQCFPCVDFFKMLLRHVDSELSIYDRFRKMSFHNRYVVAGANGIVNLTIPIKGGREQKKLIAEVEIDTTQDWQKKHWRTLVSAYSKAPFFDYYAEEIRLLIFSKENNLANFNLLIFAKICKWLKIKEISLSTSSLGISDHTDYRNTILPKNFQDKGLQWTPKYPQVFEDRIGFQPNLSILDLLFNVGPNSANLLINS